MKPSLPLLIFFVIAGTASSGRAEDAAKGAVSDRVKAAVAAEFHFDPIGVEKASAEPDIPVVGETVVLPEVFVRGGTRGMNEAIEQAAAKAAWESSLWMAGAPPAPVVPFYTSRSTVVPVSFGGILSALREAIGRR